MLSRGIERAQDGTDDGVDDAAALVLPSGGPEPVPFAAALAALTGYARGRRPLFFRPPNERAGRWVRVPAFGFERFDRRPRGSGAPGDEDVLTAEGLHGRLDPAGWASVRTALDDVAPLAAALAERAAGRPFWALPAEEFSVLAEPGTVGALLRQLWARCAETPGVRPEHVLAALHHREPALVPLATVTVHRQLWPHLAEADSGPAAQVHRELVANAGAFAALERAAARVAGTPVTRLRLHDLLLWLRATLRFDAAVALAG